MTTEVESGSVAVPTQEAPTQQQVTSDWPPPAELGGPDDSPATSSTTEEPQQEQRDTRTVPLAALHEERNRRKAEQQERQRLENEFRQLQAQQVQMMQYLQAQQTPPPPKYEEDPLGNIGYGVQHVANEVAQLKQDRINEQRAIGERQMVERFAGAVSLAEQNFAKEAAPDYYDAVNWAKSRKMGEYVAAGMTEQEAGARLTQEVWSLAQSALSRGDNPAEVGYRMAQAMGYQPKTVSGEQRLAMQRAGTQASTPSGGASSGAKTSIDALLKMSSKEFLKATEGDNWKKFAGKL